MKILITFGSIAGTIVLAYLIGKDEGWTAGWFAHKNYMDGYVDDKEIAKESVHDTTGE